MNKLSVLLCLLVFEAFCAPANLKGKVGEHALTWTKVGASQTPHIRTRRWGYYGGWGYRPYGWGYHRPWGWGWRRPYYGGYGMPYGGYGEYGGFGGYGGYPYWR
ncbi:uncharacterized protein CELE_C18D11.9 [Caenorhabditis elegans]|uniref:Uncharacterized protein n=1 Tax=Caenorhabditis elegans TaxID=6239 RepID=A1Z6D5_CAEEL|nr:Uncharacterized protein CELE_C18D11.9 [Caenorhabditis elegans]CAM06583.2 Uncharacterized protein CELE_C18D11.9 [Caenorhabditis elegans]|eukprot:NP_001076637.2 Uncharacterized protein CELE_C18D11.9 [Caenorhabditis elegans]